MTCNVVSSDADDNQIRKPYTVFLGLGSGFNERDSSHGVVVFRQIMYEEGN